jgi:hypothetical protein
MKRRLLIISAMLGLGMASLPVQLAVVSGGLAVQANVAGAAAGGGGGGCTTKTGFLPSLYDGLTCKEHGLEIKSASEIWTVVANVVRILMAAAGALGVIFIVVGAIWYITSAGDSGRIQRAKEIILQAILGLVVVIVAYTAVTVIAAGF